MLPPPPCLCYKFKTPLSHSVTLSRGPPGVTLDGSLGKQAWPAGCPAVVKEKKVGTICALGFDPEKTRSPGPPETPGNAFSSRGRRRRGRPKPKFFPAHNPPARLTSLPGAWNVYFPTTIFCRWRTDQNALLGVHPGFLPEPPLAQGVYGWFWGAIPDFRFRAFAGLLADCGRCRGFRGVPFLSGGHLSKNH